MLSTKQLRKIDKKATSNLTDEQLTEVRKAIYEHAQLMFDVWYEEKFGSKNPLGLLTIKNKRNIIKK